MQTLDITSEDNAAPSRIVQMQPTEPVKKPPLFININHRLWQVERRHEMTQLMLKGQQRERKLYLFFFGPDGETRRGEIAEDFPMLPDDKLLLSVWQYAEVVRNPVKGEMHSRTPLEMPSLKDTIVKMSRSVALRCPNCGKGSVLKSWFNLKHHCDKCFIRYERGESSDYFTGGLMFNIILAELIFAVVFIVTLIIMWPNIPWQNLEYILAIAAFTAPIILYPISRVMWLAFDLLLRPPTEEEMEWHAANQNEVAPPRQGL